MYVDDFGQRLPSPGMEHDHFWPSARARSVTVLKELYEWQPPTE